MKKYKRAAEKSAEQEIISHLNAINQVQANPDSYREDNRHTAIPPKVGYAMLRIRYSEHPSLNSNH